MLLVAKCLDLYSLQAIENGKDFSNKASASHAEELKPLKKALEKGVAELIQVRVCFTEGLLVSSLSDVDNTESLMCIRAELGAIAGNIIPRDEVHPTLIARCEAVIS